MTGEPKSTVEPVVREDLHLIWSCCTEMAKIMAYPSFFCSGEWLRAAAGSVSAAESLVILAVKREGRVKALLPLVSKGNLLGGKDLHFLGTRFFPDPLGLLCAPVDRPECAATLKLYLVVRGGWDRLILDSVLEDEAAAWGLAGDPVSIQPFKRLSCAFDDLLSQFRQKKRYNLRAAVRKFFDAGGEFVASTEKGSHGEFLDALLSLHRKRAIQRKLQSTFQGACVEALHRDLLADAQQVRFYGLRYGERLVAVVYGFEFCNRFFYYQVAHEPSLAELSPGSVLLFLAIEDCCKRGVEEFNFLQGDEPYKGVWADTSRVLYRCTLDLGTWRSSLLQGGGKAKKLGKRALRVIRRGN